MLTSTLREFVDEKALMAKTRRLDLSFNELLDMYRDTELEIQPAFQRIFVWDIVKQSQFIESLLLELPVPPIYVVEQDEGKYVLVDGLQRLSTYLHFRGVLTNHVKGIIAPATFALEGCDIAEQLNGKEWKDLDTALQIRLKRATVSVQVIRKESNADLKFHMFKRLNDGGTPVSPQQVRNCVIRMLDHGTELMDFVERLSNVPEYVTTCVEALTQEQRNDQFEHELILRFFSLKNDRASFKHLLGPFMDSFAENIARIGSSNLMFDFEKEEAIFKKTFGVLAAATGEYSFTFPNRLGSDLSRGFSAYHFEGATLGLQSQLALLDPRNSGQMNLLGESLKRIRLSREFREVSTGGGRNSPGPLSIRIRLIEEAVRQVIDGRT